MYVLVQFVPFEMRRCILIQITELDKYIAYPLISSAQLHNKLVDISRKGTNS
jgi:hypothetical protein